MTAHAHHAPADRPVHVSTPTGILRGLLGVPEHPLGLVVLGNGSGDLHYVMGNAYVAAALRDAGIATLMLDLLTAPEAARDAESGELRFELDFIAKRFVGAAQWVALHPTLDGLPIGLLGGGTSASGALVAAAQHPELIATVVSRGGRPELAGASLARVRAPTLLLVGALDAATLATNRRALDALPARSRLQVVSGARHLLEEPATLRTVAGYTASWYREMLRPIATQRIIELRWALLGRV